MAKKLFQAKYGGLDGTIPQGESCHSGASMVSFEKNARDSGVSAWQRSFGAVDYRLIR